MCCERFVEKSRLANHQIDFAAGDILQSKGPIVRNSCFAAFTVCLYGGFAERFTGGVPKSARNRTPVWPAQNSKVILWLKRANDIAFKPQQEVWDLESPEGIHAQIENRNWPIKARAEFQTVQARFEICNLKGSVAIRHDILRSLAGGNWRQFCRHPGHWTSQLVKDGATDGSTLRLGRTQCRHTYGNSHQSHGRRPRITSLAAAVQVRLHHFVDVFLRFRIRGHAFVAVHRRFTGVVSG